MFDGVVETTENEMMSYFAMKKKILNSKYTAAKSKEAKLEPLKEGIKEAKAKILELLMRKNAKIRWYDKLPQDHQFYKHYINIQSVEAITQGIKQKVSDNHNIFEQAAEKIAEDHRRVMAMADAPSFGKKAKIIRYV